MRTNQVFCACLSTPSLRIFFWILFACFLSGCTTKTGRLLAPIRYKRVFFKDTATHSRFENRTQESATFRSLTRRFTNWAIAAVRFQKLRLGLLLSFCCIGFCYWWHVPLSPSTLAWTRTDWRTFVIDLGLCMKHRYH